MKQSLKTIFNTVVLAVFLLSCSSSQLVLDENMEIPVRANKYERAILENIHKKRFREAVLAAARYEHDLPTRYSSPTFQNDLFQSERYHLSFQSPFTDWEKVEPKEIGFDILLALQGKANGDSFFLLIEKLPELGEKDQLLKIAKKMASDFGVVKSQQFQFIGHHRMLVTQIDAKKGRPLFVMINVSHDTNVSASEHLFTFVLSSSPENYQENEKRLFKIVQNADFHYKPADEKKVKAIQKEIKNKFSEKKSPFSILYFANELSAIGEYNLAADELAELRNFLSKHMQKPYIERDTAKHPAYGIYLTNPDKRRWKLSIERVWPKIVPIDLVEVFDLEDAGLKKNFRNETGSIRSFLMDYEWWEGIKIGIFDPVSTFGPKIIKKLDDKASLEGLATNVGRSNATSIGSIERERHITIKGNFAHEAIINPAFFYGVLKIKQTVVIQPGFILVIFMIADTNDFQKKFEEYDRIINGEWLQIGEYKEI